MITLSMIVKNEEKFLSGCLDSVIDIVDEIIIVDTGSTDSTKDIASHYGAKIFDFTWINDFSAPRNFALEKSTGDWILYLDADERLNSDSKDQLLQLAGGTKKNAYTCIVNSIDEIKNRPSKMDYVRFFPRHPKVNFEGAAHEQIIPSLIKTGHKIVRTTIEIIHLGYNISAEDLAQKAKRNLELLLKDFVRNKHSYTAFQIAQSYSLMNNEETAVEYFKTALQDNRLLKAYKAVSLRYLAAYQLQKLNLKDALKFVNESLSSDTNQPLTYLVRAQVYQALKDYKKAEADCRSALQTNIKITNRNEATEMVIMIDNNTIVYNALNICLMGNDRDNFNYYFSLLSKNANIGGELEFYNKIINNAPVEKLKIKEYAEQIKSDSQVELTLNLLSGYSHQKAEILYELYKNNLNNINLLNQLAIELEKNGNYKEAKELLKKSISLHPENPASYLFYISLTIRNNDLSDTLDVIKQMEDNFHHNSQLISHTQEIKKKIKIFLDSKC